MSLFTLGRGPTAVRYAGVLVVRHPTHKTTWSSLKEAVDRLSLPIGKLCLGMSYNFSFRLTI